MTRINSGTIHKISGQKNPENVAALIFEKEIKQFQESFESFRHDIRNPLSSLIGLIDFEINYPTKELPENSKALLKEIRNYCEEALRIIQNGPKFAEEEDPANTFNAFLEKLKKPTNHILVLTKDVPKNLEYLSVHDIESIENSIAKTMHHPLIITEIKLKKYKGNFEEENLDELVENTTGLFSAIIKEKNLDLDFEKEKSTQQKLLIDKNSFDHLLMNVLKNAIEASPRGEKITISAKNLEDNSVELCFHNQGEIPEEIQGRFGEKNASYGKEKGTGLGVYIIKLVTGFHGGNFGFKTSKEGGTYIYITLPNKQPPELKF